MHRSPAVTLAVIVTLGGPSCVPETRPAKLAPAPPGVEGRFVCYEHSRFDGSGASYTCDAYVKRCFERTDGTRDCGPSSGFDGATGCVNEGGTQDTLAKADAILGKLLTDGSCVCTEGDNFVHLNPANYPSNKSTCKFLPAAD